MNLSFDRAIMKQIEGSASEIDVKDRKFLMEQMGECWHTFTSASCLSFPDICLTCGKLITSSRGRRRFDTWQDFGDVFIWATSQSWWKMFCNWMYYTSESFQNSDINDYDGVIYVDNISPVKFSKLVIMYLRDIKKPP